MQLAFSPLVGWRIFLSACRPSMTIFVSPIKILQFIHNGQTVWAWIEFQVCKVHAISHSILKYSTFKTIFG